MRQTGTMISDHSLRLNLTMRAHFDPPAAVCTDSWPSDTRGTESLGYWASWEAPVKIQQRGAAEDSRHQNDVSMMQCDSCGTEGSSFTLTKFKPSVLNLNVFPSLSVGALIVSSIVNLKKLFTLYQYINLPTCPLSCEHT